MLTKWSFSRKKNFWTFLTTERHILSQKAREKQERKKEKSENLVGISSLSLLGVFNLLVSKQISRSCLVLCLCQGPFVYTNCTQRILLTQVVLLKLFCTSQTLSHRWGNSRTFLSQHSFWSENVEDLIPQASSLNLILLVICMYEKLL